MPGSLLASLVLRWILGFLIPVLLFVGALLLWRKLGRWFAIAMLVGTFLGLLCALSALVIHPLLPFFKHLSTGQYAKIALWLAIFSRLFSLTFAVGFLALAVSQKRTGRIVPEGDLGG